ncbi:MAG: hypothetical protein ACHP79_01005 [Terriglobales bacterium]
MQQRLADSLAQVHLNALGIAPQTSDQSGIQFDGKGNLGWGGGQGLPQAAGLLQIAIRLAWGDGTAACQFAQSLGIREPVQ